MKVAISQLNFTILANLERYKVEPARLRDNFRKPI